MEPCKLDIKAPAMLVIPISENEFDRWAFNDLVDHYIGHNVKTQEELTLITEMFWKFHTTVEDHFREEMLGTDREEIRKFHKKVIAKMEIND